MIRALLLSRPTCTYYTHSLRPCHVFQRPTCTSRAGVCILTHRCELDLASEGFA